MSMHLVYRGVGFVACLVLLLGSAGLATGATKVACVGDRITYGASEPRDGELYLCRRTCL